ncbi:MAG: hypothetical protein GKS05_13205 [Nitrospirales bacterium]|nr:hypothetical protein [Nitrospirales bacterium]
MITKTATYPAEGLPETPYLKAQAEWDAREGRVLHAAKNWRVFALICLGLLVLSVMGNLYLGTLGKVQIEVVEVDSAGRVHAIGQVGKRIEDWTFTQALIEQSIRQFLKHTRSLSIDPKVVEDNWRAAYFVLSPAGTRQLNQWVQAGEGEDKDQHNPFIRMANEAVDIKVESVLALSNDTVQAEWKEMVWSRKGEQLREETWRGTFTFSQSTPNLETNPIGFFIEHFSWGIVDS